MREVTDVNALTPAERRALETGIPERSTGILPPQPKTHTNLAAFGNDTETAYNFGRWLASLTGDIPSIDYCKRNGIQAAGYLETDNTTGGVLVPPQFDNTIVRLVNKYGTFRANARTSVMRSDVKNRPRRTGGLTAYFVGEQDTGTESTGSWDNLQLTAKKIMVLTKMSSELSEDAMIDVADHVATEIAYAFGKMEDDCGYLGDGTSTYGGIYGTNQKLIANDTDNTAGVYAYDSGYAWSNIELADLHGLMARLPSYAVANAKWFCSARFYWEVMYKLAMAAGGVSAREIVDGVAVHRFGGHPVVFAESFPTSPSTSEIQCLLGDLSLAADFGDRRQMSLDASKDAYVNSVSVWESDEIALRGTERFDINVHDVGSETEAGPIVGLKSHSS
jgi:HK97 family phage major capsid protein